MFAFVQRLCTTNDTNGNGRRVYQVATTDRVDTYTHAGHTKANVNVAYYDEGNMGPGALPDLRAFTVVTLPDLAITPKEYRKLKKIAEPS